MLVIGAFFKPRYDPILTQSVNVVHLKKMVGWLVTKYSVFVNFRRVGELLTCSIAYENRSGEVIVATTTWVSDIASCIAHGFDPVSSI